MLFEVRACLEPPLVLGVSARERTERFRGLAARAAVAALRGLQQHEGACPLSMPHWSMKACKVMLPRNLKGACVAAASLLGASGQRRRFASASEKRLV